jgi:hypothetical protein
LLYGDFYKIQIEQDGSRTGSSKTQDCQASESKGSAAYKDSGSQMAVSSLTTEETAS